MCIRICFQTNDTTLFRSTRMMILLSGQSVPNVAYLLRSWYFSRLIGTHYPSKHVNRPDGVSFCSTTPCVAASTSAFVLAFMTETLAKHPASTTVRSSGSTVLPHVCTSFVPELAGRIRVNTHWKSSAAAQSPEGAPEDEKVVLPKFTLSVMPCGRMGPATGLVRRIEVSFVVSAA